jgi:hypothetical protein
LAFIQPRSDIYQLRGATFPVDFVSLGKAPQAARAVRLAAAAQAGAAVAGRARGEAARGGGTWAPRCRTCGTSACRGRGSPAGSRPRWVRSRATTRTRQAGTREPPRARARTGGRVARRLLAVAHQDDRAQRRDPDGPVQRDVQRAPPEGQRRIRLLRPPSAPVVLGEEGGAVVGQRVLWRPTTNHPALLQGVHRDDKSQGPLRRAP